MNLLINDQSSKWKSNRKVCSMRTEVFMLVVFFFFQAEDGIRDVAVTGVQTCALPIYQQQVIHVQPVGDEAVLGRDHVLIGVARESRAQPVARLGGAAVSDVIGQDQVRSEERRVGKEGRSRWSPDH